MIDQITFPRLNDLKQVEIGNIAFSDEVHTLLTEKDPDAEKYPLIYIGSGGDLISALLISDSEEIVLIDNHKFLTSGYGVQEVSQFQSSDELYSSINGDDASDELIGVLTRHDCVRPGFQILATLKRLGIDVENIGLTLSEDGSANFEIKILLQHGEIKTVKVHYICEEVTAPSHLKMVLGKINLRLNDCGLLAKGGTGELAFKVAKDIFAPRYIVCDDPRQYLLKTLTPEEERVLFENYSTSEVKSTDDIAWGYSWGEEPHDESLDGESFDYKARAVVAIRDW
jgi:hypothetical protein